MTKDGTVFLHDGIAGAPTRKLVGLGRQAKLGARFCVAVERDGNRWVAVSDWPLAPDVVALFKRDPAMAGPPRGTQA